MIVVIAEDEPLVAGRIERFTKEILKEKLTKVIIKNSLPDAMEFIFENPVDLLLLDLNLHGKDGFELLKHAVSGSFHTIIISAHTEKAIEAFEYGVLDFLGKPFSIDRLEAAISRIESIDAKNKYPTKFIAVRKNGKLLLIEVDKIIFVRGAGIYSEIILKNGSIELHDKSLNKLDTILPTNFLRIHRSYIVNLQYAKSFSSHGGSKYSVLLNNGEILPVSRNKYKEVKNLLT
ncbi:MAG: response regulator transcription factor [bacterium]|nr:response regulator transcription factor [bacterium]